jgi:hypothetical protein
MREIKFRQAIFKDGKFHHWHYWGYGGLPHSFLPPGGAFVAPIEIHQQGTFGSGRGEQTYEVKDSQEYIGLHIGELGLGGRIYEGDILSPIDQLSKEGNQVVKYSAEAGCAGFVTSGGLTFDECAEIIGSIHETPELMPKEEHGKGGAIN